MRRARAPRTPISFALQDLLYARVCWIAALRRVAHDATEEELRDLERHLVAMRRARGAFERAGGEEALTAADREVARRLAAARATTDRQSKACGCTECVSVALVAA